MPSWLPMVWIVMAYLVGSIPFGLLIGFMLGMDIRKQGSGNIGATNLGRVAGRKWGITCFLLDLAKGLLPVVSYALVMRPAGEASLAQSAFWLGVVVAPVLGHVFPVWLGFKGGKGVATGFGVVLGMWPWMTLAGGIAGLLWLGITYRTGYVSLGSVLAALSLPVTVVVAMMVSGESLVGGGAYLLVSLLLAGLVLLRHRGNLVRLRAGTEGKVGWSMAGGDTP